MKLKHKKIDFVLDKEYILERHCRINYACWLTWQKTQTYAEYQKEWFNDSKQVSEFTEAFLNTLKDKRTIAEIIQDENGETVGYLWLIFVDSGKYVYANISEIYVEEAFRRHGIANTLMKYMEQKAREYCATSIRGSTSATNIPSIKLHKKNDFEPYWCEFEKLLSDD